MIYPVIRAGNFEGGASHVSDLMELTLSGIDANDLPKTWATLRFYTGAMTHSYLCHDSFLFVPRLMLVCHDLFIYVP